MKLEEWHAYIAVASATENQRGRIMAECARLGLLDRAEHLAMTARLLGLGELGSTKDLTMGEAGRLVRLLPGIRDRAGWKPLPSSMSARPRTPRPGTRPSPG